jgi:hypothetical protein
MAKRYHESKGGMPNRQRVSEGQSQTDPRGHMDREMITNASSEFANMPKHVEMKEYPRVPMYGEERDMGDNISGLDRQMSEEGSEMKKHMKPRKA